MAPAAEAGASRPGSEYGKNFDANLRQGLLRETELFFDSIVREDRPVTQLLTADYTFLNERVAQHYGNPGRPGQPLPTGGAAGGFLSPRTPRPWQSSHVNLAGDSDVPGDPRQVHPGDAHGHAAARAAG